MYWLALISRDGARPLALSSVVFAALGDAQRAALLLWASDLHTSPGLPAIGIYDDNGSGLKRLTLSVPGTWTLADYVDATSYPQTANAIRAANLAATRPVVSELEGTYLPDIDYSVSVSDNGGETQTAVLDFASDVDAVQAGHMLPDKKDWQWATVPGAYGPVTDPTFTYPYGDGNDVQVIAVIDSLDETEGLEYGYAAISGYWVKTPWTVNPAYPPITNESNPYYTPDGYWWNFHTDAVPPVGTFSSPLLGIALGPGPSNPGSFDAVTASGPIAQGPTAPLTASQIADYYNGVTDVPLSGYNPFVYNVQYIPQGGGVRVAPQNPVGAVRWVAAYYADGTTLYSTISAPSPVAAEYGGTGANSQAAAAATSSRNPSGCLGADKRTLTSVLFSPDSTTNGRVFVAAPSANLTGISLGFLGAGIRTSQSAGFEKVLQAVLGSPCVEFGVGLGASLGRGGAALAAGPYMTLGAGGPFPLTIPLD